MIALPALLVLAVSYVAAQDSASAPASASRGEVPTGTVASYSFGPTATGAVPGNTPREGSEYWPGYTPLNQKNFTWGSLPYKVDTAAFGRGPQSGYNLCNSTTAGDSSECQTIVMDSMQDFCLWGLTAPGETVGDSEASAIAFCVDYEKYGTRPLPENTITGMTWLRTPQYIQITGKLDQTKLNIAADDFGGEMDPVGADYRGNPLGGLVYSDAFTQNGSFQQIHHWNYFVGSNTFCYRICLPDSELGTKNCEHIYDRIGCAYNSPSNAYTEGVFEVCDGDAALPVGTYVEDGATRTWTQPSEELGPITSVGYTPSIPPSSNCVTPTSLPNVFALNDAVSASSSASSGASGSVTGSATIQTSPASTGVQRASNSESSANKIAATFGLAFLGSVLALAFA